MTRATKRPVWLLDIDGVINAAVGTVGRPPGQVWKPSDWIDAHVWGSTQTAIQSPPEPRLWRIVASRRVVEFIREVHESGRAEVRWHTTWQHDAANMALALELPKFEVAEAPEFLEQGNTLVKRGWWKLPAALRVLRDEGRPLVWTDDEIGYLEWKHMSALLAAGSVLPIAPQTSIGLTAKHLVQIDIFLDRYSTASHVQEE